MFVCQAVMLWSRRSHTQMSGEKGKGPLLGACANSTEEMLLFGV